MAKTFIREWAKIAFDIGALCDRSLIVVGTTRPVNAFPERFGAAYCHNSSPHLR